MKILQISSYGYVCGGTESLLSLVIPELKAMGHDCRLLTSDEQPDITHFSDYEFESFHRHPYFLQIFEKLFYVKAYRAVRKIIKEFQPDIVHIHTTELLSPSVFFGLRGTPAVMSVHGSEEYLPSLVLWAFPPSFYKRGLRTKKDLTAKGLGHYYYHRLFSRTIFRIGFRNVNQIMVQSRFMQTLVRKEGFDSDVYKTATKPFEFAPIDVHSKVIAFAGRLEEYKGPQNIIKAMPAILETDPAVRLVIAGAGSYGEALKKLVRYMKLEKSVEFPGKLSRRQVNELYKESIIEIMPSVWPEPFGLSSLEALSVGRPVIATNVGGVPEWITDNVEGRLVEPDDPQAIADAVIDLLGDQSRLLAMSLAARKKSEDYTMEKHTKSMVHLYQKTLKKTHK